MASSPRSLLASVSCWWRSANLSLRRWLEWRQAACGLRGSTFRLAHRRLGANSVTKERTMPAANDLPEALETTEAERLATGFIFTEGPLWHPEGYWYFVDIRQSKLFRMIPGKPPEVVRDNTLGGNGTTFDLQGRLILCEGDGRLVTRMGAD